MNAKFKAIVLVVLVVATGIAGYYGLQDFGNGKDLDKNGAPVLKTTAPLKESAQQSQSKSAVTEPDIESSRELYSEQMAAWNTQNEVLSLSAASGAAVLSSELLQALNKVIAGTETEEELSAFIHQYSSTDLGNNQKLIALLIGDEQPDLALELATLLWQSNPGAEEAKTQYALAYKSYTTKVLNQQNEIISGGAQ